MSEPLIPRIARAAHELTGPHVRPTRVRVSPQTHYDLRVEEASDPYRRMAMQALPAGYLLDGLPLLVDPSVPDGVARIEVDIA